MMMHSKPSYYAILEAHVRYSDKITHFQKLLYAEITALANKNGFCFASNKYFADLYDRDPQTISRDISALQKARFIHVDVDPVEGNLRKITLLTKKSIGIDENVKTPIDENVKTPIDEKINHNITSINTTRSNSKKREKKSFNAEINEVIIFMRDLTGMEFLPGGKGGYRINFLLNEGYTVDQLKAVVRWKWTKVKAGQTEKKFMSPHIMFTIDPFLAELNEINDHNTAKLAKKNARSKVNGNKLPSIQEIEQATGKKYDYKS